MNHESKLSQMIKSEAIRLGFNACGIAKAEYLKQEANHLKYWLDLKLYGGMKYMKDYFDKRVDPTKLFEGARSVISVILSYNINEIRKDKSAPIISKYALGKDYHVVIKRKLIQLLKFIEANVSNTKGRAFIDTAPLLERAWAAKAGLGWIGKNSILISRVHGSFVFIGTILINTVLEYDSPVKDLCGNCNKCIEACPTNAIIRPKLLDARKCISYLTVVHKLSIPDKYKGKFQGYIFGCDICQNICPWNENKNQHDNQDFKSLPKLLEMTKEEWYNLQESCFKDISKDSPMRRIKFSVIKRNIEFVRT
jgi:epoxyqueuosine reductase